MPFNPTREADYILGFADIVRRGTTSVVFSVNIERIKEAFFAIHEAEKKKEAILRLTQISRYGAIHIEDQNESKAGIADEIGELAEFVRTIR